MFQSVTCAQAPAQEWPESMATMRALEDALKCSICQDWLNTPKLLPCGHTYCSDCIRQHGDLQMRAMHSRTCPECRAPWQESDLAVKAVHSLAVAVKALKSAKQEILAAIGEHNKENPVSSLRDDRRQPQSRKRIREPVEEYELPTQRQSEVEGANSGAGTPNKAPGKGPAVAPEVVPPGCGCCPMCNRVFSLRYLQNHVDSCLISTEAIEPSNRGGDMQKDGGDGIVDLTEQPEDVSITLPQVPPKICFQLLKEKEARKKLQDLGLSALGDKNELEKRYQSFRQYVQTAHDQEQSTSLSKLARAFTNVQQRRVQAMSAPQRAVEGADSDFATLIEVTKRRIREHKAKQANTGTDS